MTLLTKDQEIALEFAQKYPGWHTYGNDKLTFTVISALAVRGLVEVNTFQMFRLPISEK